MTRLVCLLLGHVWDDWRPIVWVNYTTSTPRNRSASFDEGALTFTSNVKQTSRLCLRCHAYQQSSLRFGRDHA